MIFYLMKNKHFKTNIMKKLIYLFLTVLIVACSGEDGNNDGNNNNQSSCNGDNPVYLADNGITIKACDDANIGDTGVVNGVTYTVVDEAMLREMVANEEDVTRVVTTRVTNMSELFFIDFNTFSDFNQDISSWDVSNVADMSEMFLNASSFNQPIGDWDVSNVTDMSEMFEEAFAFNQPVGNWDVSNVNNMNGMFEEAFAFNQPIGNWDVISVTNMSEMFEAAFAFNQPIGDWDVSNVTNMYVMFLEATSFNQDLSFWSVDGVTECNDFSYGANSWTLPQPNFTNCTP